MEAHSLLAAWTGFLLGILSGIIPGLMFHNSEWMGGYGSWRRRLTRLGHISFFGIGFLNLGFAVSVRAFDLAGHVQSASLALIIGAVTMPLFCYLSAWRKYWRHLFFIPVCSLGTGIVLTLIMVLEL